LRELLRRVLSQYPDVRLCIIFGSAATGRLGHDSDLDIAVAAAWPLAASRRLELIEAFSASTNREIDLIDLTTASGLILKQALSKGVILQNRDKGLYARLISKMLLGFAQK